MPRGAGDTYVATLALALAAGADPHGAAFLAATATAVIVTEPGTTRCHPLALRRALMEGNKRVMDQTELTSIVAQHRGLGQRIVFTNGCFRHPPFRPCDLSGTGQSPGGCADCRSQYGRKHPSA